MIHDNLVLSLLERIDISLCQWPTSKFFWITYLVGKRLNFDFMVLWLSCNIWYIYIWISCWILFCRSYLHWKSPRCPTNISPDTWGPEFWILAAEIQWEKSHQRRSQRPGKQPNSYSFPSTKKTLTPTTVAYKKWYVLTNTLFLLGCHGCLIRKPCVALRALSCLRCSAMNSSMKYLDTWRFFLPTAVGNDDYLRSTVGLVV